MVAMGLMMFTGKMNDITGYLSRVTAGTEQSGKVPKMREKMGQKTAVLQKKMQMGQRAAVLQRKMQMEQKVAVLQKKALTYLKMPEERLLQMRRRLAPLFRRPLILN